MFIHMIYMDLSLPTITITDNLQNNLCQQKCVHPDAVKAGQARIPGPRDVLAGAEFFKVFGDQTRLSLLMALRSGELCVCDLACVMSMTDSAISHQLAVLRRSGMILPRRDGKIIYYRLADAHVDTILDFAFAHLAEGARE